RNCIIYIYVYQSVFSEGPEGTLGTHLSRGGDPRDPPFKRWRNPRDPPKKNIILRGSGGEAPGNFLDLATFRDQISLAETSPKSTLPIESEDEVPWAKKSEND